MSPFAGLLRQGQRFLAWLGLKAGTALRMKGVTPMSRKFQLDNWPWDVFVCHAGPDKPFALALSKRLPAELRCFVDEQSLNAGDCAPECMEDACKKAQIAVVLLSRAFFSTEHPCQELRWILDNCADGRRTTPVPVFLGVTVEECSNLAKESGQGLEKVCEFTGIRHMWERSTVDGRAVTREDTMRLVVDNVRALTGV